MLGSIDIANGIAAPIITATVLAFFFGAWRWAAKARKTLGFISKQMESNGAATNAGTDDQTLRDTVDRMVVKLAENTSDTNSLRKLAENNRVRTEERHEENLANLAKLSDKVDMSQATIDNHISEDESSFAAMDVRLAEMQGTLDARSPLFAAILDRLPIDKLARNRDDRPPALEPGDDA